MVQIEMEHWNADFIPFMPQKVNLLSIESHYLAIDINSSDIYKRLTNKLSSQKLITDSTLPQRMPTLNEFEVASSSDESDFVTSSPQENPLTGLR
ncbi:hypothetical protein CEXT_637171 [Caerostris extrusa]|uniref:Uncharacterized protein n=1 Tax=Caerostris extrusa TaxID=172846 RepID=A0AAV4PJA8_CAEEX|nr:hypothetical protein CEXT_637171 [Caerostris extrusa]